MNMERGKKSAALFIMHDFSVTCIVELKREENKYLQSTEMIMNRVVL